MIISANLKDLVQPPPRYNIAPAQYAPVILHDSPKQIHFLRWGLIPSWAKDEKIAYKTINARSETIFEKAAFRSAVRARRCLVIADGFYEWKKTESGKQPYWIHFKTKETFTFAGIYESWQKAEGELLHTYTILTTRPNSFMETLHHRMPVILPKSQALDWIRPNASRDQLESIMQPISSDLITAYRVRPLVNYVKHDTNELIQAI